MRSLARAVLLALLLGALAPAWAAPTPEEVEPESAVTATPVPPPPPPAEPTDSNPFAYQLVQGSLETGSVGRLSFTVTQNQLAPKAGFVPVAVGLTNGPRGQKVRLAFTCAESSRSATRMVELAPGESRAVTLAAPQCSNGSLRIATDEDAAPAFQRLYFERDDRYALLVVGAAEHFTDIAGPTSPGEVPKLSVAPLAPAAVPGELAALAGFDTILLTGVKLEDLTQPQARALEAYAATGGRLVVTMVGPGTRARLPLLRFSGEGQQDYGFGQVAVCLQRDSACARTALEGLLSHQQAVRPADGPDQGRSHRYDARYGRTGAQHFLLPQALPPVGRFLVIITLFSLVMGPGSLLIARRRGPAMLLFTIPAISLTTCLLIVGYSLAVDGFSTHARTLALTLLDRKHAREVTVGLGGLYANLSPGPTRFGPTTAVVLPFNEEKLGASVDWTEGATFGSDLIPSRTYRELAFLSVDSSRARLGLERAGLKLRNGLGARIRWVKVRVGDGFVEARDIADGAEARGERVKEPSAWQADVDEPLLRFNPQVAEALDGALQDGDFLAVLEGPGPLPLGGLRAMHHDSLHVIRGEVE